MSKRIISQSDAISKECLIQKQQAVEKSNDIVIIK